MRKSDIKDFVQCILLPLFVGGLAALFTMNSMQQFQSLEKPPLSPPAILFPIVWTLLYVLMGIASYLIFKADASGTDKEKALRTYGVSLIFNFLWPIFFFRYELYLFSFLWILLLWGIILITILLYNQINKTAAHLMIPYLLWVTFAAYLNLGIYLLNR